MTPPNWFDQGRSLLGMPLPGAAAASTSPGVSGSDYLLLGGGGASALGSGLASLSPHSLDGTLPPFGGGGDGSDPGAPAPSNDGLSSEAAAGLAAALSGAMQGFLGFGLNSLGANPTLSFSNSGFHGSLNSGVPGIGLSAAKGLGMLGSLFGGPLFSLANALGGAVMGGAQGVATRGGDFSGANFGNGTANAQAPGFFAGFNNSLSDAARGRGHGGDDSEGSPTGPTTSDSDATSGMSGIGAIGDGPAGGTVGDGTAGGIGGSAPGGEGGAGIGSDGSDGGGGGGGGGGSTVICTELRRQGLMDDATWRADEAFGRAVARDTLAGYQLWGRPLARLMARSSLATKLVAPLALRWAREMAYRMGARPTGSLVGCAIMAIGLPLCTILGRLIASPTLHTHRSA